MTETSEMLRVGSVNPYIYMRTCRFVGSMETQEVFKVDDDYFLEFVPVLIEPDRAVKNVELKLSFVERNEERLLVSRELFPIDSRVHERRDRRFELLSKRMQVDLGVLKGRQGKFRWQLRKKYSGESVDMEAGLGNLRLIPKVPRKQPLPSILFVCSDAHRYDYSIGEKGATLMPALQELSSEAVVYHRAYSNASWTLPSIASTFTGLFPRYHLTGQRIANGPISQLKEVPLEPGQFLLDWGKQSYIMTSYPPGITTLTECLQRLGYETHMVCSNPFYILSGLFEDGQDFVVDVDVRPARAVNRSALQLVDSLPVDRPAFLLVHYMDMHHFHKFHFYKRHPGKDVTDLPEEWIACYEQAARDVDEHVAEVVEHWNAKFGSDASMIVFYADHGKHLPERGRYEVGHGDAMDDQLLHVPLVIKYPTTSGQKPGQVNAPVSLTDLYPTVLDVVGMPFQDIPHAWHSLLALPQDQNEFAQRDIFADYQLYLDDLSSIRRDSLNLIFNLDQNTEQLVDLSLPQKDRGEEDQFVASHSEQASLRKSFDDYVAHAEREAVNLQWEGMVDAEQALQGLRALGYTQ